MVFQGPSVEALDLRCQGRAGQWFPGLGHRNLVQVAKKRILELVEVFWERGISSLVGAKAWARTHHVSGDLQLWREGWGGDLEQKRGCWFPLGYLAWGSGESF